MRIRLVAALAATLWVGMMATSRTSAAVDLELRTPAQPVTRFAPVDVTLYAVWDGEVDIDGVPVNKLTIVNVALSWDPTVLALDGPALHAGNHSWNALGFFGFLWDEKRDGLNADCGPTQYCSSFTGVPFNDGDAFFQTIAFSPEESTTEGVAIATFSFVALADDPATEIVIEPILGNRSPTILQFESTDVLGELFGATVAVQTDAVLIARDVSLVAGRTTEVVVSAEVLDQEVFGVEVLLEIVPGTNVDGVVEFTPEFDITQLDDPWSGIGDFVPFESDQTFSPTLNGCSVDSGTFQPWPLTFVGDLVAIPLFASSDALGSWDLRLATSVGDSAWFPELTIKTAMDHGTLTIVELGDGDGSGLVDLRDDSEFQVCFTGDVGPVDPPAFYLDPDLRCGVYDFDDDGDVDWDDHAEFLTVMSGPTP